jgi:hypothetical protein
MEQLPHKTIDFIKSIEEEFEDYFETDVEKVGTPEYWKKAGIIEYIRKIKSILEAKE